MITHDQLIFSILKQHPELVHGKDFWVGQEVDGDVQITPAKIYAWNVPNVEEPTKNQYNKWCANDYDEYFTNLETTRSRTLRDQLLKILDELVTNPLRWNEISENDQLDIKEYRRLLLDVPQQDDFPHEISWPKYPLVDPLAVKIEQLLLDFN